MAKAGDPVRIGTKTLKNRLTMAPTVKFLAGNDGIVTDWFVRHYAERARHSAALICVEATCVTPEARLAPTQLGLWNDGQIPGHARLAAACHEYDCVVIPQLHFAGLSTHPACGPLTSPSETDRVTRAGKVHVPAMTRDDIRRAVDLFVFAAVRAQKAGYDGVQLHACHSYLINDFASGVNTRDDEYGGDAHRRARLGSDIIRGIREACGQDFLISARVSGFDPDLASSFAAAEEYVAAGCDYLQVSNGLAPLDAIPHDDSLPYNRVASLGVRMHERFRGVVPVSCVNCLNTPEKVNHILNNDLCDTVDLARPLLADPAFCEAVLNGTPYRGCRECARCGFGPVEKHYCTADSAAFSELYK